MTDEQWNEYKKKSRGWSIRMGFELLHSEAYRELNYGPAVKVLTWFYEKVKIEVNKGKRGKGKYRFVNGSVSFTYKEAEHRGLSHRQFNKALRELYRLGFIEILKPGSALKGDWTEFAFSERWRVYGTADFKESEFPKSVVWRNFGFGSKARRKKVKC